MPEGRNQALRDGEEVYRMFCLRVARDAFPSDPNGLRFVPYCEGKITAIPAGITASGSAGKQLGALLARRADAVAALDQVLGDQKVDSSKAFAKDELKSWLTLLLPFYGTQDPSGEDVLPRSTKALAKVMEQLNDPKNQAVLDTIARISTRVGYRAPERVLAAVRPALVYDRIDELTKALLALTAADQPGHAAFKGVLEAAALELAQPAEEKQTPTTLSLALDLLLRFGVDAAGTDQNALFIKAETDPLDVLPVLQRDDKGDAIPVDPSQTPPPFLVAGRPHDGVSYDDETKLALGADGKPAYQTFDANQTALASLMRDSVSLIQRGKDEKRSTIEMLLRSARPLLGKDVARTEKFGDAKSLTYMGPDVEHGPMSNMVHALTTLLKLPETKPLLQMLDQLLSTNESAATELIYAALQIRAESKKPSYDSAQLGGGKPHEFWDDLIGFGQELIEKRPGVLLDVLNSTLDPLTAAQGPILAHQMQNKDVVTLPATDINADVVVAGCAMMPAGAGSAPAYCSPVDRTMPDVGPNRSIFQRVLSMIHATYKTPICNKEGATLTVQDPIPTTFPNPGGITVLVGCPDSTVAPPPATSYKACQLISQVSGAVSQMRGMLGKGIVVLSDDEIKICAAAVGSDLDATQEKESGIKGFTFKPTAKAIARFSFGPRNKFLTDLFNPVKAYDPALTADKQPNVTDYEPNAIWPLEVIDPQALGPDGKGQSFLTAAVPLLDAFDKHETFKPNGDYIDKYYFAELMSLAHMHYGSPKTDPCPVPVVPGNEGCVQSADPTQPFFSHGTNLQSYEPLIIYSLLEQNLLSVLQRSTKAFKDYKAADGKDGVQVLEAFLEAMLKPNESVQYRDGTKYAKTNTCVVMAGADGAPACAPGPAGEPVGRIIQGGVPPLYLLLDALAEIDKVWEQDKDKHDVFLQVRSTLVDKLLDVTKAADGSTSFTNRRAYALTRRLVPYLVARIDDHNADLEAWADGLVGRMAGVLGHPLAARALDLFDDFWDNQEAGDEVAKLLAYLVDDKLNPQAFTGTIIALADTLTFLDKDPDLTPAIRFAALALAEDSIDIVEGENPADAPNVEEGTAYRFLEVTRKIGDADDKPELSTLAKILRNAVLPMANSSRPLLEGKSPLEVFIDLVAEVNRVDPTRPSEQTLDAVDDKQVFDKLRDFLSSDQVGLERLYNVIENRNLK